MMRTSNIARIVIIAGVVAAFLTVFASVVLPVWTRSAIAPVLGTESAAMSETREVPGDPTRFDPIAGLDRALAWAGPKAQLDRIYVSGVRSDGTLDLTADFSPAPSVTYEFHREVAAPSHPPPVGAGGSTDGRWFEAIRIEARKPGTRRQVTRIGGGSAERYNYISRGLDFHAGDVTGKPARTAIALPVCSAARLWADAIARGAPANAVARIRYDARGAMFTIPDRFSRRYGVDCNAMR